MFRENLKREFIEYYLTNRIVSQTAIESIFNSSERLEVMSNKDVCNFTKPEIVEYYKSLNAKSKERIALTNTVLKEYKVWCMEKGECYDDAPYYDTFTQDDFKRYISKNVLENKYIGIETLNSYLKEIYNPCDQLLLVLLHNGVKGKQLEEIINLNVEQIDGNILHLSTGRDVEVDDSVIALIHETNNTYVYYTNEVPARKYELSGDNVFKNSKVAKSDSMASIYHRFSTKMATFQKMFDNPELAINRIWISGMLNALLSGAKVKNLTFRQYISTDEAKAILEKYEFNRYPTKVVKLFEEYLDYIK